LQVRCFNCLVRVCVYMYVYIRVHMYRRVGMPCDVSRSILAVFPPACTVFHGTGVRKSFRVGRRKCKECHAFASCCRYFNRPTVEVPLDKLVALSLSDEII